MELYEAINARRTVREFLDKKVDFEAIKRILEAGNKAPTWNHNRNWSYTTTGLRISDPISSALMMVQDLKS